MLFWDVLISSNAIYLFFQLFPELLDSFSGKPSISPYVEGLSLHKLQIFRFSFYSGLWSILKWMLLRMRDRDPVSVFHSQFPNHHLLKRLSLPQSIFLATLSKLSSPWPCGFMHMSSVPSNTVLVYSIPFILSFLFCLYCDSTWRFYCYATAVKVEIRFCDTSRLLFLPEIALPIQGPFKILFLFLKFPCNIFWSDSCCSPSFFPRPTHPTLCSFSQRNKKCSKQIKPKNKTSKQNQK